MSSRKNFELVLTFDCQSLILSLLSMPTKNSSKPLVSSPHCNESGFEDISEMWPELKNSVSDKVPKLVPPQHNISAETFNQPPGISLCTPSVVWTPVRVLSVWDVVSFEPPLHKAHKHPLSSHDIACIVTGRW